jgi:hypothetical protein
VGCLPDLYNASSMLQIQYEPHRALRISSQARTRFGKLTFALYKVIIWPSSTMLLHLP